MLRALGKNHTLTLSIAADLTGRVAPRYEAPWVGRDTLFMVVCDGGYVMVDGHVPRTRLLNSRESQLYLVSDHCTAHWTSELVITFLIGQRWPPSW